MNTTVFFTSFKREKYGLDLRCGIHELEYFWLRETAYRVTASKRKKKML